jgi:hypothetical protein
MTRPLKKPLYDNIVAIAPDGEPLCRCNREKADWYLARNLAELVSDEPTVIRLKFEPKGRGHAGDQFYLAEKHNICVVCGTTENHTRHHIVPYCFRKYFPDKAKRHNSHDIVPMCVQCHDQYEAFADQLKKELSQQYGVPFVGNGVVMNRDLLRVKRHASALQHCRDRIPKERVEQLYQTLREFFQRDEITAKDVEQAARIRPVLKTAEFTKFGEYIVKQVKDLEAFVVRWRKHFINTMKPAHMPKHWKLDRKIIND